MVLFSPLLDHRAVAAVTDLRQRGRTVVVVDVLTSEPPVERGHGSAAALRLWRLDRRALRYQLAEVGVPVLSWDGCAPLDQVVGPLARLPILVGRTR